MQAAQEHPRTAFKHIFNIIPSNTLAFTQFISLNTFYIVLDYLPFSFCVPSAHLRFHVCPVLKYLSL